MQKKILIVGAGYGQMPAIIKSKELGLYVIAVDKNPDAIGSKAADLFFPIDILDKESILSLAKEYNIDGIFTMQSDLPMPTVGFVNDSLNLSGVSFGVANDCSNKINTRQKLLKYNCSQPDFIVILDKADIYTGIERMGLPCILKAPDSSGSRGVVKLTKKEDIDLAFEEAIKYSICGKLLLEEFVNGIEFGAQTFSTGGECDIVLLHNDTMSLPPYMVPIGHSFPFKNSQITDIDRIKTDIKNAVNAVGICDGPANVDLIYNVEKNKVYVIEIGARIGATCLPELVYYHTNIDWVGLSILSALGVKYNNKIEMQNNPVAALIVEAPKDGIFNSYEFTESVSDYFMKEFEISVTKGDAVNTLKKGTDRIGKIIAGGKTVLDAEENAHKIRKSLSLNII